MFWIRVMHFLKSEAKIKAFNQEVTEIFDSCSGKELSGKKGGRTWKHRLEGDTEHVFIAEDTNENQWCGVNIHSLYTRLCEAVAKYDEAPGINILVH